METVDGDGGGGDGVLVGRILWMRRFERGGEGRGGMCFEGAGRGVLSCGGGGV